MVPISETTSSRLMPMPLSVTVSVRASVSATIRMCGSLVSASSPSRSAASRSLSSASDAFEMSSRRKMSLFE